MKEIRAYVRREMAEFVVNALVKLGCQDFSAINIRGLTRGLPRKEYKYAEELGEDYKPIVKFEIVCRDENAPQLVDAIRKAARTGKKGDGVIFVAPIEEAIRIRDDERGVQVLAF